MSEDIANPAYWKDHLYRAQKFTELHHSIFRCPLETWMKIEAKHKQIIAQHVGNTDSVLDCGCGYGRLLTMMPKDWEGGYLGVDISPDMIDLAREWHSGRQFVISDLRNLQWIGHKYEWAILISMRPMIRRNMGDEVWEQIKKQIRQHANKLIFLEYDESDSGEIT